MSILTSDVWNNEINIEPLNILVHSRSKVEVFFWQTLFFSPPPPHDPHSPPLPPLLSLSLFTNALCALASPIHHSASGGRKSTFPGWVFFSSASAAVSVGTRETSLMDTLVITGRELWDSLQPPTPSPPSPYLHLSLFHSPRVFTSTFLCPSSVVHSFLTMMTTVPAWILPCKVARPSETSHTPFQGSGLSGCCETWTADYSLKTNRLFYWQVADKSRRRRFEIIMLVVLGDMQVWA